MASFTLFASSVTPRTLATGEIGFIGQLGSLAVTGGGDAITSSGDVSITVLGSLYGDNNAVEHGGGSFRLHVSQNGVVAGGSSDTLDVDFTTLAFVSNDGSILSDEDALDIRGTGNIRILNSGSISGDSDAIVTSAIDGLARIVNSGTIWGGTGGIDHLDGNSLLINNGVIVGTSYGFDGGSGVDQVRNTGRIEGIIRLADGADRVDNRGDVGRVDLGVGNDIYIGRGNGHADRVDGGAGQDRVENRGVIDRVDLGSGNDTYIGRGDGHANRVDGRAGRDRMISSRDDDTFYGGGGADTFVFAAHGGSDTIGDFAGGDKINLTALGLRSFAASIRSHIEEVSGGTVIDLSKYDLMIFLRGVDETELTASDFLL